MDLLERPDAWPLLHDAVPSCANALEVFLDRYLPHSTLCEQRDHRRWRARLCPAGRPGCSQLFHNACTTGKSQSRPRKRPPRKAPFFFFSAPARRIYRRDAGRSDTGYGQVNGWRIPIHTP
jgi:hypothetical protein